MNKHMTKLFAFIFLFCICLMLSSCVSDTSYAPVVNAWQEPEAQTGGYRVHEGDTIYSIAWIFGLDYRDLAAANDLKPPYDIHAGQALQISTHVSIYAVKHQPSNIENRGVLPEAQVHETWVSPTQGPIVERFSSSLAGNRGVNISGHLGQPVYATASGEVVYSGDGVRGYGNLLLIKHSDSYLSAYAYNKKLLVAVGQHVRIGQRIAEMGRNIEGQVMLHFEIRHNGKPVNPERYISTKP